MYKLNNESTEIFCQLLDTIGPDAIYKIDFDGIVIHFEKLDGSAGSNGSLELIEIATQSKRPSSAITTCLMRFFLWDRRLTSSDYLMAAIYPQALQRDPKGQIEVCVFIEDKMPTSYDPQLQKAHVAFAEVWFPQIVLMTGPFSRAAEDIAAEGCTNPNFKPKSGVLRPRRLSA